MPRHFEKSVSFQLLLERVKSGVVKGLLPYQRQLDSAVVKILSELRTPNLGELRKRELNELLEKFQAATSKNFGLMSEHVLAKVPQVIQQGVLWETAALTPVFEKAGKVFAVSSAKAAFQRALSQPISATGHRFPELVGEWGQMESKRLGLVLQRAWGEGWTVQRTITAIRGTRANGFSDGVLATSRRNAEAITRTVIQHTANMGRMATWEENKDVIDGYTFLATLDGRTTTVCRALDGKEFAFGKGPVPPLHINCRSTTKAKLSGEFENLSKGSTRASKNGQVDSKTSYYEWLKSQPVATQKQILGPSRAKLFAEAGPDKFSRMSINWKTLEPMTLDQMEKAYPAIFTKALGGG